MGPEECNLGCLDACVIVCLLSRWPDSDELDIFVGRFGIIFPPNLITKYKLEKKGMPLKNSSPGSKTDFAKNTILAIRMQMLARYDVISDI